MLSRCVGATPCWIYNLSTDRINFHVQQAERINKSHRPTEQLLHTRAIERTATYLWMQMQFDVLHFQASNLKNDRLPPSLELKHLNCQHIGNVE